MKCMAEWLAPLREDVSPAGSRVRFARRRRRLELRSIVTGVALFVAVAWTIVFGMGIVLR